MSKIIPITYKCDNLDKLVSMPIRDCYFEDDWITVECIEQCGRAHRMGTHWKNRNYFPSREYLPEMEV